MLARRRTHWVWPASLQHSKLDIWGIEIFKVNSCTVQIVEGWHSTSTCVGNKQWTQKFALKKMCQSHKKMFRKKIGKKTHPCPLGWNPSGLAKCFWATFQTPLLLGIRSTLAKGTSRGTFQAQRGHNAWRVTLSSSMACCNSARKLPPSPGLNLSVFLGGYLSAAGKTTQMSDPCQQRN